MNEIMNKDENRKIWLDILRIIASFAVVIAHISHRGMRTATFNSADWSTIVSYSHTVPNTC